MHLQMVQDSPCYVEFLNDKNVLVENANHQFHFLYPIFNKRIKDKSLVEKIF